MSLGRKKPYRNIVNAASCVSMLLQARTFHLMLKYLGDRYIVVERLCAPGKRPIYLPCVQLFGGSSISHMLLLFLVVVVAVFLCQLASRYLFKMYLAIFCQSASVHTYNHQIAYVIFLEF